MTDSADENLGMGGSYVVGTDGNRVLVERTKTSEQEQPLPVRQVDKSEAAQQPQVKQGE